MSQFPLLQLIPAASDFGGPLKSSIACISVNGVIMGTLNVSLLTVRGGVNQMK